MDGNEIGVLKKSSKVGFGGLLEGLDGGGLETKFRTDVLGKLANEPLKRKLAKEKLCGLLVPPNLTKRDGARAVAVRLLDTSSRDGAACSLGDGILHKLLFDSIPGSGCEVGHDLLASDGLARGLAASVAHGCVFGACHVDCVWLW